MRSSRLQSGSRGEACRSAASGWQQSLRAVDLQPREDAGAILILALIFVIVVTLAIFGLVTFGGTGILNSTNLKGQRALEFAADGATTSAIQAVRYSSIQFSSTSVEDCLPDGAVLSATPSGNQTMTINGITMTVDCIAAAPPTAPPTVTRAIVFFACQQGPPAVVPANCLANNALLVATVYFDDISPSGVQKCSSPTNAATCGSGMSINSWVVETANN